MVRARPLVKLALGAMACATGLLLAADAPAPVPPKGKSALAKPPAPSAGKESEGKDRAKASARAKKAAPTEPIERQSYKIRVWLSVDPSARLDAPSRTRLIADWQLLVRRFVGAPWVIEMADGDGPLATETLEGLNAKALAPLGKGVDKAWMIRVEPGETGHRLSGREFDVLTGRLGPLFAREAPYPCDAPRVLLKLSLDLFEPTAEIGAKSGGGVFITVRGGGLTAASPEGQVITRGRVFRPLRIWLKPDGSVFRIDDIRRSFLRVSDFEGRQARCDIVSALADPLTSRTGSRNRLVALGVKPSSSPTRFQYLTVTDRSPAAGYVMTARTYPDGPPVEVGMTDRDGRLELRSGFSDGLVVFRLLAADIEPVDEFPAMPGITLSDRPILINPKPQTVTLETQLNGLRDELIDQVAVRARIESRLKARVSGEKWDEAEELLAEYRALPRRAEFVERLEKLRADAQAEQTATKRAVLTRKALNMISDTQALIDRYLDDELFKAYADAIAQVRKDSGGAPASGVVASAPGSAQGTSGFPNTPEGAYKAYLLAVALGDEAAIRNTVLPSDGMEWLTRGARPAPNQVASIKKSIEQMKVRRLSAGDQVALAGGQQMTVERQDDTPDIALVMQDGAPAPSRCRRMGGRWKVDAAPEIAARRAADADAAARAAAAAPTEAPPAAAQAPARTRKSAPAAPKGGVTPF